MVASWETASEAVGLSILNGRLKVDDAVEAAAAAVALKRWLPAFRLLSLAARLHPRSIRVAAAAGDVLMAQNLHYQASTILLRLGRDVWPQLASSSASSSTSFLPSAEMEGADGVRMLCRLALSLQRSAQFLLL